MAGADEYAKAICCEADEELPRSRPGSSRCRAAPENLESADLAIQGGSQWAFIGVH